MPNRVELHGLALGTGKGNKVVTIKPVAGAAGSTTLWKARTGSETVAEVKTNGQGQFYAWLDEGEYEVTIAGLASFGTRVFNLVAQKTIAEGGAKGEKGETGDKGPTGDKGATGDPGPEGPGGDGLIHETEQTADYTLVLTDVSKCIEFNKATAIKCTVPTNASVAFEVGTIIELSQTGAGQLSVVAAGGVTIRSPSTLNARARYSTMSLRKRATNEWLLSGDLE